MEQHEADSDLRDLLQEKEAEIAYLKMNGPGNLTEADTGSSLPINAHTALGSLFMGPVKSSPIGGELNEEYNSQDWNDSGHHP